MKKSRITTALLAIGISASMVFQTPVFATEETAVAASSGITTNGISGWPQGPEITSASAVIMEDTSDTLLYAKDMDTTLSPAGAVKIMTCLLALENSQLDDQVTMTETGVSGVTDGGAHISSQLGEVFTMEQCLYALMLASANDIALQVAEQIGGSVGAFVQKMNDRAKELGCTNTVFTNPTGLPDDNQHTTAHDLALIMQAAIRNDSFRTISGATSYTIPATNVSGGTRNLTSSFTMTDPASASYYEGCIGGRESTTTASGSVLVTAAQRNGTTLIAVVMNGATGQTANEAISLLDYGFARCSLYIDEQPDPLPEITVQKGISSKVSLKYADTFRYVSTDGEKITTPGKELKLPDKAEAPLSADSKAGEIIYLHPRNGQELGRIPILYAESVARLRFSDCLLQTFDAFCL